MTETLTRDDILKLDDCKVIELEMPEWDTTVYIRTMSGHERDTLEMEARRMLKTGNAVDLRARYAAYSLSDPDGKRMFSDLDIPRLAKKSGIALDRIMEASERHNRIGPAAIEEAEKNLEPTPSEDSGSI